jgi:hypothetical protein
MADETKKTGGVPVFDTDRAWERFERLAAPEPVPAFWKQADINQNNDQKDGVFEMKQKGEFGIQQQAKVALATGGASSARTNGADGAWRTERPAKRRIRRLTAGVAAAAMTIGLIATPIGDHIMAAMQQTFRIQQIEGVGITADDLATISNVLEKGSPEGDQSFNLAQYGTLTQSGGGASRIMDWSEAESLMGTSLLQLGNSADPSYQPATALTFQLKVEAVNRLLARLGSAAVLPPEADGKAIRLYIPDGVVTEGALSGKPARLLQFGKPELTVEDGIDAEAVREAVLTLPVLPDSLRTKLASIGDWQNTLPVPARDGATTNLRIGGHDAVMTSDDSNRYLLWLDGERMALLSVNAKDFPAESGFQQAAEELILP